MTGELLIATFVSTGAIGSWLLVRFVDVTIAKRHYIVYRLQFARDTDPTALTTFVAGLSGLRPSWYRRWARVPHVIFEVHARHGVIEHWLIVPRPLIGVVLTHLRASLPSVRMERQDSAPVMASSGAAELGLSTTRRPLRTDRPEAVATALLSSLQPLRPSEQLVVQWVLTVAPLPKPPRLAPRQTQSNANAVLPELLNGDGYELLPHVEALKAQRAKLADALFDCVGRVGVRASTLPRSRYLLDRVLGAFHLLDAPGVRLRRRPFLPSAWARRRTVHRTVPLLRSPTRLNAAEVACVIGWPLGDQPLPGVSRGGCRQLPPSADIPSSGDVVAIATYPGSERPLAIAPADRYLHCLLTGPTGSGKSTVLLNLINASMRSGVGVVVIDPKGDLCRDALTLVPESRVQDVIVLDPADSQRPVGFDLLAHDQSSAELAAEHVVFIFHQLFAAFWGPRTDDVLRASLLTLQQEPGMTLLEVPLLLTNPNFRRRFVAKVSDDTIGLGAFWGWYDALSAAERAQIIGPVMNKLRATLLRSSVRYCIGQSDPGLVVERAINSGKVILVPLRKGLLGDEAAALLGSLFVARVWQAVQARADLPDAQRRPLHLYIDEVQDYLHLPTSVGDMLSQARSYKLAVTVAHQHLGQLPSELRHDLLSNCRSKIVFQTTAADAHSFEREFKPYLEAEDLQGLGRFEVVAQLAVGQRVAPPVTGVTQPPPLPSTHGERARALSRQTYGRSRDDIDEAMRQRHQVASAPTVIGRKRIGGAS